MWQPTAVPAASRAECGSADRIRFRALRIRPGLVLVGAVDGYPRSNPVACVRATGSRDACDAGGDKARASARLAARENGIRALRFFFLGRGRGGGGLIYQLHDLWD